MRKIFCDRCSREINDDGGYYSLELFPVSKENQLDPDVEWDLCSGCKGNLIGFLSNEGM